MRRRDHHAPVWAIWGLLGAFALVQAIAWTLAGGIPTRPGVLTQVIAAWSVMIILASLATRRIGSLTDRLREHQHTHEATLSEINQLQTQNAILDVIARSVDATLAFQALAARIASLVDCDRVGLALLSEDGREFQTYTARVQDDERRTRPRPEIVFKIDQTLLATVIRSREPLVIGEIAEVATDFLDANVMLSSGFHSALIVPLVSKGRAVGTLNLVSRRPRVYHAAQAAAIQPIAELFAVTVIAQQLQVAIGRFKSTEAMSELTLATSAEIHSALQAIIGHCDLLERGYPDPELQRDLATVVSQAQRIATLLEKMRAAANERLREVEAVVSQTQGSIPTSPEGFDQQT
jgi:GAF domain-containing protein